MGTRRVKIFLLGILFCFFTALPAEKPVPNHAGAEIRGAMELLASDAMQGRGSGTP